MAGVQVEMTLQGIEGAAAALGRLAATDFDDLAYNAGGLLESSARERIATEKAAPDGTAWAPWTARYDETRNHGVHSLLVQGNHLLTSVQNYTRGREARVGTNLIYGAIHQMGGEIANGWGRGIKVTMPARPYLGISEHDRRAITSLVHETIRGALQ